MSLIKYFLTVVLTAVPLCFATEIHAQQSDEYFGETYLFFDTETTGLPLDHKLPSTDTANWPRLVQWAGYSPTMKVWNFPRETS